MLCMRFFRCVDISDLAHSKENGAGHEEPVMQVRFTMDSCWNVDVNTPSSQTWEECSAFINS